MDLIFNITEMHHKDRLTGKVYTISDYMYLKLSVMEILMSFWSGNPADAHIPYVQITQNSNLQRAFIVCKDKISSFGFEYHIKTSNRDFSVSPNNVVDFHYGSTTIDAQAISEAKSIYSIYNAREENTYSYAILDVDEYTTDAAFVLFESLFMLEPGYIRFDHDVNSAEPIIHPLDHFDVNYSKFVRYKLGLQNRATITDFVDTLDKNTRCRMLT